MEAFLGILVMVAKCNNCPYFPLQLVILIEMRHGEYPRGHFRGKWAVAALDLASGTYIKANGHWALGIGHWALGVGHWALGIGH
ncbi:hypothetical protein [Nostoc sp. JL33]|uniref:hypothetical protein n=1 Tax=Nostoc sp. JL33 TaxID=2815396 RepID=UPI0025D4C94A|nr:hypothetical protein [Nostoc sp. JL33]